MPSWQVVQPAEGAATTLAPAAAPIAADLRNYAEWFAWATRGGAQLPAAHAAAQAAVETGAGAEQQAAAAAAMKAANPHAVDEAHQVYSAWYALAAVDMGLDSERAHAYAAAGYQALESGAPVAAATAAAQAAIAALPAARVVAPPPAAYVSPPVEPAGKVVQPARAPGASRAPLVLLAIALISGLLAAGLLANSFIGRTGPLVVNARSVALQAADVPKGLNACPQSATGAAYLKAAEPNGGFFATEWPLLEKTGPTESWVSVFADSAPACAATFVDSAIPPTAHQAISWVTGYQDSSAAIAAYKQNPWGFLTTSPDAAQLSGAGAGLGPNSLVARVAVLATFGVWQVGRYLAYYAGYQLGDSDNTRAMLGIEARAGGRAGTAAPARGAVTPAGAVTRAEAVAALVKAVPITNVTRSQAKLASWGEIKSALGWQAPDSTPPSTLLWAVAVLGDFQLFGKTGTGFCAGVMTQAIDTVYFKSCAAPGSWPAAFDSLSDQATG